MALLVRALVLVQTVSLYKLATAFEGSSDHSTHHRRIQGFISSDALSLDAITKFIFCLLPIKEHLVLSMDRTNWKLGKFNINALMISVTYKGVAFPLMFKLLPKRGNSNQSERVGLMLRFIAFFGTERVDCLVADRESIGQEWIKFLEKNGIAYYIRIKENLMVTDPKTNAEVHARTLFSDLDLGQERILFRTFFLKGNKCYLAGARLKNQEGKPELQIIVSYHKPENAIASYALRWQIETGFHSFKSAGFNIDDTHLNQIDRVERLFALVSIAMVLSRWYS